MPEFIIERIYSVPVEQMNALNAAKDRQCNQATMAGCYADCLAADYLAQRDGLPERIDWHAVNGAILARWPKGLERIKDRAWKLLKEMPCPS